MRVTVEINSYESGAFKTLVSLQDINLSHNRLQYLIQPTL